LTNSTEATHFDVVIIGAGISGINAAHELITNHPGKSFVILDALSSFGGTWLTHTYPGVRSDTELYTLGYSYKPWKGAPYAGGADIHTYLGEVIEAFDVAKHIQYNQRVESLNWDTASMQWTVGGINKETKEQFSLSADFIWSCHGYYRQEKGYTPTWPGMETFEGEIIHPQSWPENTNFKNKHVVVIGSGATAATLVPAIANNCGHVTVLQRSPAYFFQSPNKDDLADQLRSDGVDDVEVHAKVREKAILEMQGLTNFIAENAEISRNGMIQMVTSQLPEGFDVAKHFTPRYLPSEQRVARILDGDFFKVISSGQVSMVTDEISTFTPSGVITKDGTVIDADVVITATGFELSVLGDDAPIDVAERITHRGVMFSGVPNYAWSFGALRLSWTTRIEVISDYISRMLTFMDGQGTKVVTPTLRPQDQGMQIRPFGDPQFSPGYVQRARNSQPRSGDHEPWMMNIDYWDEREKLPKTGFDDGTLVFEK
jgi:cation diffusion facilitator CzcD-associated flavoprotein CzcO